MCDFFFKKVSSEDGPIGNEKEFFCKIHRKLFIFKNYRKLTKLLLLFYFIFYIRIGPNGPILNQEPDFS